MESLNLESAELIRIAIIGLVLLGGLGLLRLTFKLATRIIKLGCLGIVIIVVALLVLGMMS